MSLEPEPQAATVMHYVMGRGARRAWEAINSQMGQPCGAVFWIGGGAGCGKTHFLNYVTALSRRAGSLTPEPRRNLTMAIEFSTPFRANEVEHRIIKTLAAQLRWQRSESNLWRELGGIDALGVVFDQARRQGVDGLSAMLDFGTTDPSPSFGLLQSLANLARTIRGFRLIVVAAGRGIPPPGVESFDVAPENEEERIAAAIGRARYLTEAAHRSAREAYRDFAADNASQFYPLHPRTVQIISLLARDTDPVATMAAIVRECVIAWQRRGERTVLVCPAELMECARTRRWIDAALGAAGRTALNIAHAAADLMDQDALARELVDTLALHFLLAHEAHLGLPQLQTLLPTLLSHGETAALEPLLAGLSAATAAVVQYDRSRKAARFNPNAGVAAAVAAFNRALPLMRHFDASLAEVSEAAEIKSRLSQLGTAMAEAVEAAHRAREMLESAMGEDGGRLSAEQEAVLAGFIRLAEGGAASLLEAANDERREAAARTLESYRELAAVAAAAPRLRQMRQYLLATGLPGLDDERPNRDFVLTDLELRAKALVTEANPLISYPRPRQLELLDNKFRQFKAEYIGHYCCAHEQWRGDISKALAAAEDLRRHLEALRRLNLISALGEPQGGDLFSRMESIKAGLIRCEPISPLALETSPLCSQCGFVLGRVAPNAEIAELMKRARRLLHSRLAALSQNAIARLIREHDYNHRLDGFLKIVQAAQTKALIEVLDDDLAGYLARLLDENQASQPGTPLIRKIPSRLSRGRARIASERAVKG